MSENSDSEEHYKVTILNCQWYFFGERETKGEREYKQCVLINNKSKNNSSKGGSN